MDLKFSFLFTVLIFVYSCSEIQPLDYKKIEKSSLEKRWEISSEYISLSSQRKAINKKCQTFNKKMKDKADEKQLAFLNDAEKQLKRLEEQKLKQRFPYSFLMTDTLYRADSRYVSLCIETYEMLGGANGITQFDAINYDLKKNIFLEKEDILDIRQKDSINTLLKIYFKDPEHCYTFDEPTTENCSAVNFSTEALIFTYEKYVLGPGYCGTATISIPFKKLKGLIRIR